MSLVFADRVWKRTPGSQSLVCKSQHYFWNVACMWVRAICGELVSWARWGTTIAVKIKSILNWIDVKFEAVPNLELLYVSCWNLDSRLVPASAQHCYVVSDLFANVNKILIQERPTTCKKLDINLNYTKFSEFLADIMFVYSPVDVILSV